MFCSSCLIFGTFVMGLQFGADMQQFGAKIPFKVAVSLPPVPRAIAKNSEWSQCRQPPGIIDVFSRSQAHAIVPYCTSLASRNTPTWHARAYLVARGKSVINPYFIPALYYRCLSIVGQSPGAAAVRLIWAIYRENGRVSFPKTD